MVSGKGSANYLHGVPELLILRLLSEREMYGYELVAQIRSSTQSVIQFGEGVIYPVLHALQRAGHVSTRRAMVNGRVRLYYRTTASGRKRLARSAAEWERIAGAVRRLLKGESGDASLA